VHHHVRRGLCSDPPGTAPRRLTRARLSANRPRWARAPALYTGNYYASQRLTANVQSETTLCSTSPNSVLRNCVNIYRVRRIWCTALGETALFQWAVCGTRSTALAHPSGASMFLFDFSTNITDIGRSIWVRKQIPQRAVSYDGPAISRTRIAYGVNDVSGALDMNMDGRSLRQVNSGRHNESSSSICPIYALSENTGHGCDAGC